MISLATKASHDFVNPSAMLCLELLANLPEDLDGTCLRLAGCIKTLAGEEGHDFLACVV